MKKVVWKLGGLMCKGAFSDVKRATDPGEVGGAPLLGVKGSCIIGHGNFGAHAIANGINAVGTLIRGQINDRIVESVHQYALESI